MQKNRSDLIREFNKNNGETPNPDIIYSIIDVFYNEDIGWNKDIDDLYLLLEYISFLENKINS